jgi:hypothetical protein
MKLGKLLARVTLFACTLSLGAPGLTAPGNDPITIEQSRGVDQRVRYSDLRKYGPWDDRNYQLTLSDMQFLSADEHELHNQLPAFFRIELRKEWPHLRDSGPAQYPRAALQLFLRRYGGLMQNGKIADDHRKRAARKSDAGREVQLNQVLGANEITVAINPVNPLQVIAGANNFGGQEMYYSTDGGATWTVQGTLPNTCCDPTVDWSSDGSTAYAAALSGAIGVSFWRSFDGGQSWVDRVNLTTSGSDKEYIHVDKSSSSPHQDNIYITYHNGNVMQFARSVNGGTSFEIQAFPGAPIGIGSDITTDAAGNIYYFYGAFGSQQIIMLKSTDGGVTFAPPTAVASTNVSFDFPIPSMETRRAWITASADADLSDGPFAGSIYVAWTDTVGPEDDVDPLANHARVQVAWSRDGGATWNISTPHSVDDMQTVDRWNQWLAVDEFGNVHVVYYDTRNSVDRSGVDLYYTYSIDGGVTWAEAQRVSSATSANLSDLQEFGDYNGVAVLGDRLVSAWTDNRDGPPDQRDVYADDMTNVVATPGFTLNAAPLNQSVCAPANLDDITVSVGSVLGFAEPVTLNLSGLPSGFTGGFQANPVTPAVPANSTVAQVSIGSVPTANYSFDIVGTATGADTRTVTASIDVAAGAPIAPTLVSPANGAGDVSTAPLLTWDALPGASSYIVEFDDDPGFASIDFTTETSETSVTPTALLAGQVTYYWRVRAVNVCGTGVDSAVFSFTTSLEICRVGVGAIPDAAASFDTMVVTDTGQIADLDVALQVTHTWVGDLSFALTNESTGTSVSLVNRPGEPVLGQFGCNTDNIDVTLDDEGTAPVEDACAVSPAISGRLTPDEPLIAFDGEELAGTWRLDVIDAAAQDTGTLDRWCLVPKTPDPGLDSDGDGITDAFEYRCNSDPNDAASTAPDNEGDGIPDCIDDDDDNDGVPDAQDAYPFGRFNDVDPATHFAFFFIEALERSGVTGGCGNDNYCPDDSVTRAQMAVFLERGMRGSGYSPPPATGTVFADVPVNGFAAAFIEQLFADGITGGCGNGNYCPNDSVTRAQMAVFLLRAKFGSAYVPPPPTGVFNDVPVGAFADRWIEQLAAEGITGGCGNGNYCPNDPVTRAQMAVFLVRTFGL